MTLHIFNPEHDIALASGLANFTAPHAGRQLRHDLGFLPAIWAAEGDAVMVDDVEQAQRQWHKLQHRINTLTDSQRWHGAKVTFIPSNSNVVAGLSHKGETNQHLSINPWGWNSALRALLLRRGVGEQQLPTLSQLDTIRELSHRRTAARLLAKLREGGTAADELSSVASSTVGEAYECTTLEELEALLDRYGHLVLKAPWSSSGRGLRFLSLPKDTSLHPSPVTLHHQGWFRNVVQTQGSVMVEPYYNKVKDFAMEFYSDGRGTISYLGLSLFHTQNGAYTGNILATEATKRAMISRYITVALLDAVKENICRELSPVFNGSYAGPFGVDMMIVNNTYHPSPTTYHPSPTTYHPSPTAFLHPCVEINLRRTMGHVALALSPTDDDRQLVMRTEYSNGNYQLRLSRL